MSSPREASSSAPPRPAAHRRGSRWPRPTTRPCSRPGGPSARKATTPRRRNSTPTLWPAASCQRKIDFEHRVRDRRRVHRMTSKWTARLLCLLTLSAPIVLALQPGGAAAQDQATATRRAAPTYEQLQEKMNAWTVGLAAGLIEGAPLRLAAEMGRVVDDGENLHVLPIVTHGPTENLNSLLYLRGVDLAIINSDALEEYRIAFPTIREHIVYLLKLFPSELHVFVRPEIQSLQDLAGKKVNFNTLGTAAAYSGPLIFSRLGINIEKTFIPHQAALQQMRKGGDMAAVVCMPAQHVRALL